ncbi:DEAD/DEAH box helicase [Tenuibacillus multivorans]|uniref:ATP-dependent RNA helicase CshB n=1 Tax=Tenuibacillus multivorans TaxID=237069 RepID=A0A1G9ZBL9_9BACI|nr:DEAD/DEAH box helicase [Tenuibacillus multivorans]GEL78297.1 DEAD-box ATP-dependent RNA helicase CshB [Tenuibacillus multivorans]SDN18729.1 ATP-dependent RNA helicase CshB [Tenuibacillus multivorans]
MNHYFQSYQLSEEMLNIIQQLHFKQPTVIQHRVIPSALRGENIIGQSQTGTGKTHAYLIPMINQLNLEEQRIQKMIIAPTRELAMQIFHEVKKMKEYASHDFTARLVIGGTDKERELQRFNQQPHVVVGTPGRILDFINEEAIQPSSVTSVVIDEADLLIDLGLIAEVDQILYRMYEDVQTLVFSATIPKKLQPFLKKYLVNPNHIVIDDQSNPINLEHRLVPRRHRELADLIVETSKLIHPYIALIFVNKKEHADELREELLKKGLEAGVIHGGLKPRERKRMLNDLRALKYQYIVATDLASRGIDIPGVSHIFNAEFPIDVETYTHRVGRTARAGNKGTAVSFYEEKDMPLIEKLELTGIEFQNYDVKRGEWAPVKEWNNRRKRQAQENELEKEAWKKVRKPKKVKPGYKKKMKQEKEQIKKQLKKDKFKRKYKKGRKS